MGRDLKDPAFLFYPESFIIGTRKMTDEEVGIYIRALCEQFFDGEISADYYENLPQKVREKFEQKNNGNFYNNRLKIEIEKRSKFVKSRQINGSKGGRPKNHMDTICEPSENHMVSENNNLPINRNININTIKNIYIITEIVEYLNQSIGGRYRPTSKKITSLVNARLNEGFTVDDFKTVIDKKTKDWLGNPDMQKYLRPETLFGTKFESYLNQPSSSGNPFIDMLEGGMF